MIDITYLRSILPHLLYGAAISLQIAACAFSIGTIGGTVFGILLTRSNPLIRALIQGLVTLIRGTPMLVQIVFLYYVLSAILQLSAFVSAIVAIGFNSSAYISQVIKAGIDSVGKGQIEAAQALGISNRDTMRYIVLPQALKVVLPALGNEVITLIKDSSLASFIGVIELYKVGQIAISDSYDALSVYFGVALLYLTMTSTAAAVISYLEKRMKTDAIH